MNKKKIRVLISAAGTLASVSYIKHLKNKGFYIIGINSDSDTIGKHFCDEYYTVPFVNDCKNFVNFIETLDFDIYVPWLDEEHILFSKHVDITFKKKILTSPSDSINICVDKENTYQFALSNKIPVANKKEIAPAFVRRRISRGSKGARVIQCQKELDLLNKEDYIIQETIFGKEYTVDCLCEPNGNPKVIVPRERVNATNVSLISRITMSEDLIEFCRNILKDIKLVGPINIQLMKTANGIYLIEINPRLAGTSILTIKAGADILTDGINDFLGIKSSNNYNISNNLKMYRFYDEFYLT
jgi:carbamoyl-phosphate synthase large subunit